MKTRFFKVIDDDPSLRSIRGDIITFFPGQEKGELYYIRQCPSESAWSGDRWWRLDEMTPDFVVEMTEKEVKRYCPAAAAIPPVSESNSEAVPVPVLVRTSEPPAARPLAEPWLAGFARRLALVLASCLTRLAAALREWATPKR